MTRISYLIETPLITFSNVAIGEVLKSTKRKVVLNMALFAYGDTLKTKIRKKTITNMIPVHLYGTQGEEKVPGLLEKHIVLSNTKHDFKYVLVFAHELAQEDIEKYKLTPIVNW